MEKKSTLLGKFGTVNVRTKLIPSGKYTIYLDFMYNKIRKYEILKLHISTLDKRKWNIQDKINVNLAKELAAQRSLEIFKGEYGNSNQLKSDTVFLDYFERLNDKYKTTSQKDKWKSALKHYKNFAKPKLTFDEISSEFLEDYKIYLLSELNQNTARGYFAITCQVFNQAEREQIINYNPARNVLKIGRVSSDRTYLTEAELDKLINTHTDYPEMKKAFIFCCYTGLRLQDARNLKRSDIIKDNGKYYVKFTAKKTKKPLKLLLHEKAIAQVSGSGKLFNLLSKKHLYKHLDEWGQGAGLSKKLTFHVARHTFATMLLNRGVDIYTVKELLQHSDISTTEIYAKLLDRTKEDAIEKLI